MTGIAPYLSWFFIPSLPDWMQWLKWLEWQQVPAWHSRHIPRVTALLPQVPSHNRYESLQVELNNNKHNRSSSFVVSPRFCQPTPRTKTVLIKKIRWVIVTRDSLLKQQMAQYVDQTHLLGKSAVYLRSWLKVWRENSYHNRAAMKLQQQISGQSRENWGPWDNWFRG